MFIVALNDNPLFRSRLDVSGNSGRERMKISRTWLTKSWQMYLNTEGTSACHEKTTDLNDLNCLWTNVAFPFLLNTKYHHL